MKRPDWCTAERFVEWLEKETSRKLADVNGTRTCWLCEFAKAHGVVEPECTFSGLRFTTEGWEYVTIRLDDWVPSYAKWVLAEVQKNKRRGREGREVMRGKKKAAAAARIDVPLV